MNWFDPVFAHLQGYSAAFEDLWKYLSLLCLGQLLVLISGRVSWRSRLTGALGFAALWDIFVPSLPLAFVPGRIGGLRDEVFFVLLMIVAGAVGITMAWRGTPAHARRNRVALLSSAIGVLAISSLSLFYHMVLLNGFDQAARRIEGVRLEQILQLQGPGFEAVCNEKIYTCGRGYPNGPDKDFNRDAGDWLASARSRPDVMMTSSNGTFTAGPTYVWAARKVKGRITWIWTSYQATTDRLELAFWLILSTVAAFWSAGPLLVEILHRRRRRRG